MAAEMERNRLERNRQDEEALIRRMKDECNQTLARQWKLAQEQTAKVFQTSVSFSRHFLCSSSRQLNKLKNNFDEFSI